MRAEPGRGDRRRWRSRPAATASSRIRRTLIALGLVLGAGTLARSADAQASAGAQAPADTQASPGAQASADTRPSADADSADAREGPSCRVLCTPDLAFEPTVSIENLAARHRTARLEDGVPVDTATAEREAVFEIVLAVGVPTEIPRVELTLEAIWAPFAGTDANPFTGRTAEQIGEEEIRDNAVEVEGELNLALLTFEETGGWLDAHFDIVDQFGPAERPDAGSVYTHKLNLELDVATAPLARLGARGWLGGLELEGSLDYMATGIPRAGDRLGDDLFLDDASPWSFSLVLVIPLVP